MGITESKLWLFTWFGLSLAHVIVPITDGHQSLNVKHFGSGAMSVRHHHVLISALRFRRRPNVVASEICTWMPTNACCKSG
ncbi:hypothetical protein EDB81DRAFT_816842 [Dactylonectria macrodidyma]|uniref:Secreted protein n=1 Tax=Dactylonectria macrodidyma TaxID=307937 RepID=A0A9P9IF32_9HYPO|nr:hypothetical protein EDB81DRAFT_816842 [Dactylonectria macrodidyma]